MEDDIVGLYIIKAVIGANLYAKDVFGFACILGEMVIEKSFHSRIWRISFKGNEIQRRAKLVPFVKCALILFL